MRKFKVWLEGRPENARVVDGVNIEWAAEQWAMEEDDIRISQPKIMYGNIVTVVVHDLEKMRTTRARVSGEMKAVYSAVEIGGIVK